MNSLECIKRPVASVIINGIIQAVSIAIAPLVKNRTRESNVEHILSTRDSSGKNKSFLKLMKCEPRKTGVKIANYPIGKYAPTYTIIDDDMGTGPVTALLRSGTLQAPYGPFALYADADIMVSNDVSEFNSSGFLTVLLLSSRIRARFTTGGGTIGTRIEDYCDSGRMCSRNHTEKLVRTTTPLVGTRPAHQDAFNPYDYLMESICKATACAHGLLFNNHSSSEMVK